MAEPPDLLAQLTTREQLAAAEERALTAETARDMALRQAAAVRSSANRHDRVSALKADATLAEAEAFTAAARLEALAASIGAIPTSGISGTRRKRGLARNRAARGARGESGECLDRHDGDERPHGDSGGTRARHCER